MTGKLSALIIALMFTSLCVSQEQGSVEIGGGVGFGYTTVIQDDFLGEFLSGVNFSVSGEYYFSERFGLKAKVISDNKGYGAKSVTLDEDLMIKNANDIRLQYLTVPVLANFHIGQDNNWYASVGPYAAFLMKAEDKETGTDYKSAYKKNDFGAFIGGGYKIYVTDSFRLFAEYELQVGLYDINNLDSAVADYSLINLKGGINVGAIFVLGY